MRGNTLISTVPLSNYMIVFAPRDGDKAQDFVQTLKRVGPPMGIDVRDPAMYKASDDRTDTFLRILNDKMNPTTQMVSNCVT